MSERRKAATVYANSEFICVRTLSGLSSMSADPDGETIFLKPDSAAADVGGAVGAALAKSRTLSSAEATAFFDLALIQRRYEDWVNAMLEKYSYRSRRALFKDLKNVAVRNSDGVLLLKPTNHEKLETWTSSGIAEADHVELPAPANAEELGKGVLLALSRCRG